MKKILGLILFISASANMAFCQEPVATLPIEQYGDHTFIKVKVNGSPELDYIFDTGDGLAILNINKATELGINSGSDETITSAEGSISGKRVKHNEFLIGGAPIHNVELHETDLTHLEISIGKDIDGIIGYDLLKNYIVEMNFDEMFMKLYDPSSYKYAGAGKAFDIKLTSYIPHISGESVFANDETIKGEFFVDTGAKATVDFNTPFVGKNKLATKVGDSYIYLVAGLGKKEYEHHRGKVKSFSFSGFGFEDMPVGLSHADHGIQNHKKVAGIIGSGILTKFNMVYDYHSKKMYWEKNGNYDKPFRINSSGLELQLSKDKSKVIIHKVFKDSPADEAGIKTNAVLDAVNGKKAIEIGLADLRKQLSKSGETVDLMIDDKALKLDLKSLL
ncbi:MAG: aspartyl protease family protein [Reichenbachiella sp.]